MVGGFADFTYQVWQRPLRLTDVVLEEIGAPLVPAALKQPLVDAMEDLRTNYIGVGMVATGNHAIGDGYVLPTATGLSKKIELAKNHQAVVSMLIKTYLLQVRQS